MSGPVSSSDGLSQNFETAKRRLEFWELLHGTAEGQGPARASLLQAIEVLANPSNALMEVALHHAGSEAELARCEAHFADETWSKRLLLDLQEYSAVFPADTRFHQDIRTAFFESGWPQAHLQALQGPAESGARAARALIGELETVTREAAELLMQLEAVRARVKPPLHILQVQALMRAELALGNLQGRKVLEVGPQEGGLLLELLRLGAEVLGVDLGPQIESPHIIQGDFLHTELPGPFDLIVATAVFEMGSCARGEPEADKRNKSPEVLRRLHALTAPGAIVVLENVMFPIPFLREDAERAGFEVLRQRMPAINLRTGGRGCVLRRG
jgi:hypothetical protein